MNNPWELQGRKDMDKNLFSKPLLPEMPSGLARSEQKETPFDVPISLDQYLLQKEKGSEAKRTEEDSTQMSDFKIDPTNAGARKSLV